MKVTIKCNGSITQIEKMSKLIIYQTCRPPDVRTALEDRALRADLDGYAEYAGSVRNRLVPGIW